MFGYVCPLRSELKIKDFETYRGYYCGLCKQLKKDYSFISRMYLSYDVSFMYLFFSSLTDEKETFKRQRCVVNPFIKKKTVFTSFAPYSAAINVLLGYYKLDDTVRDEKSLLASLQRLLMGRSRKKAKRTYPELDERIVASIKSLSKMENEKLAELDAPANTFAQCLSDIVELSPLEKDVKEKAKVFAFDLGRYIYLIDAFDDIEKDLKKGNYNPFLLKYKYSGEDITEFKKKILPEAEFSIYFSLSSAAKCIEEMKFYKNDDIIDNIVYLGLNRKTKDVFEGKTKKDYKKSEKDNINI